jgi:predicted nucleic-acid-binding Zn-ribbon protein
MKKSGKCPKCECTNIIADAKAIDRTEGHVQREMTLATFRKPDALIFKEKQTTPVSAWVCSECGYVEFYADQPYGIKLPT